MTPQPQLAEACDIVVPNDEPDVILIKAPEGQVLENLRGTGIIRPEKAGFHSRPGASPVLNRVLGVLRDHTWDLQTPIKQRPNELEVRVKHANFRTGVVESLRLRTQPPATTG
jgi:hypothetical protein